MIRRELALLGVVGLATLAMVASAAAQDPKLEVDPNSPSGREYALPLDRARQDAAGNTSSPVRSGGGGDTPAPLFGIGIGTSASSSNGRRPSAARRAPAVADTPAIRPPPALRAAIPTPSGGAGEALAIGGGGAAILLIGGFIGMLLRRRAH